MLTSPLCIMHQHWKMQVYVCKCSPLGPCVYKPDIYYSQNQELTEYCITCYPGKICWIGFQLNLNVRDVAVKSINLARLASVYKTLSQMSSGLLQGGFPPSYDKLRRGNKHPCARGLLWLSLTVSITICCLIIAAQAVLISDVTCKDSLYVLNLPSSLQFFTGGSWWMLI